MNRKYKQLTDHQRYQIEAYLKVGQSKNFIATQLGVDKTTIYRELKRNLQKRGNYSASELNYLQKNVKNDLEGIENLLKIS